MPLGSKFQSNICCILVVCHYRLEMQRFSILENHESVWSLQELHLNYTNLMRVFTSQRIAHISVWVMSHWLQLWKNIQMEAWTILLTRVCSSLSQTVEVFCVVITVPVHWNQSSVRHGAVYPECLFCLHAACCYASKCYSLLLWIPQGCWHGETCIQINLFLYWINYVLNGRNCHFRALA